MRELRRKNEELEREREEGEKERERMRRSIDQLRAKLAQAQVAFFDPSMNKLYPGNQPVQIFVITYSYTVAPPI